MDEEKIMAIAGLACGIPLAIALIVLLNAVILRLAVSFFNNMAGGPDKGAPVPSFLKACGIVLLIVLAILLVDAVIGGAAVLIAMAIHEKEAAIVIFTAAGILALPIGLLIQTGITSMMLPTKFGKGCLITLLQIAIGFLFGIVLGVIGGIVFVVAAVAIKGM